MVMSKFICAEWEFKGLTGSVTFQNKGTVLKRHSLAFLLSLLSCFFCLDSLFWHGLASLNLVISTQHHYSAQIVFDMHKELYLFHFHSCIEISLCVWYQMREEKLPLIMKHIVCFNLAWQWRYLTDKTGFLYIGTHCIATCRQTMWYYKRY